MVVCGSAAAADADANGSELIAVCEGSRVLLTFPPPLPYGGDGYASGVFSRSVPADVVLLFDGLRAFGWPTLLSAFAD